MWGDTCDSNYDADIVWPLQPKPFLPFVSCRILFILYPCDISMFSVAVKKVFIGVKSIIVVTLNQPTVQARVWDLYLMDCF